MTLFLHIHRTNDDAKIPTYGSSDAACFDIYSPIDVTIHAGEVTKINTCLVMAIPPGTSVRIHSRSGMAINDGIIVANGEGIIDADYREEVIVALRNTTDIPYTIKKGSRIAQGELHRDTRPHLMESEHRPLRIGNRVGGLGSTGV